VVQFWTVNRRMTDMEDRSSLIVDLAAFPGGVRCAECGRELKNGEHYARRPSSLGDTSVFVIVCVPCGSG
jgi:hypothetical protein